MKSLAFIVVGLGIGLLVAFIFLKSGYQINKVAPDTSPSSAANYASPSSGSTASATPAGKTNVSAGGKLSFATYTASLPSGWTSQKSSIDPKYELLEITNGAYKISINQTAADGSVCVYPGDPDPGIPFKSDYAYFKELTTVDAIKLRRSGDAATSSSFTVCAKGSENYQNPTTYGYISVKTPANPADIMLQEIDQILSSLKKAV